MKSGFINLLIEKGKAPVTIDQDVFFKVSDKITTDEANAAYNNGANWLSVAPGGDVMSNLITLRHAGVLVGRFPDGIYAADIGDCLEEIKNPGYYKKLKKLKDKPQEPSKEELIEAIKTKDQIIDELSKLLEDQKGIMAEDSNEPENTKEELKSEKPAETKSKATSSKSKK